MEKDRIKDREEPVLLTEEEIASEAPTIEEKTASKKKTKKRIIVGISIFLVIGIISGVLLYFEPWNMGPKKDPIGMYGSMKSYNNYPADYDLDVTSVPEYMDLDRNVYYMKNGEEVIITFNPDNDPDQNFFLRYFEIVINGKYEAYNKLFTDNYYKTYEPYVRFTPQMLYDIHIEKLGEQYSGGRTTYKYNVSYKIYHNTGTFRNDIGSDGSKTLYFELVEENGTILIDNINYYKF